ncbi:cell shape-determining protein MreC [Bacteroidia bacterium]|nr:cell shape-determining protein MreC [Bacteroidia bacterium]GHU58208.1 cell shape-determining protein MreC [Bacteroidia bacterium]
MLVYRNNAYQQSVMFSTANVVTANIVSVAGSVSSYLNLREKNRDLIERNGELEIELLRLQRQVETMIADTTSFRSFISVDSTRQFPYKVMPAKVVNNSVAYLTNYITIDRGRVDGVVPDMGVVSEGGVVGIISNVGEHFSVVIPILNPKFRLSCKVLGSSYFGSMSWDGRKTQYAKLDELPRHVEFNVGDTVVTSGFSTIFPEGILVGTVSTFEKQRDDNFYSLTVKLTTDFHNLGSVMVIKNYYQDEQKRIEQEAKGNG